MIINIIIFIIGILIGFAFLGILASSKERDLWYAIKIAAYNEDNTICKKLLEEYYE